MENKSRGPWRITFDTNPDDCNLHCIMCEEFSEYSNLKQLRVLPEGIKRRRMSIDLIKKTLEEVKKYGSVEEIIPSTMGEPLMFKHFEDIIDFCREYGVKLNLTTNGTFPRLGAKKWAELIVPVGSDVKISWNGVTKETAEKVMKGIDFDKNLKNLEEFLEVRDRIAKEGGNYCSVTLQYTFMEINSHELPDLVKFAAERGIDRIKGIICGPISKKSRSSQCGGMRKPLTGEMKLSGKWKKMQISTEGQMDQKSSWTISIH